MKTDLKEYESFVESASKIDSNMPIVNSDSKHAEIIYKFMLPKAKKFIHIYTDSANYGNLKGLLSKVPKNVEIKIIPKTPLFKNNFITIDNRMYRYEEEHGEEDINNVKAIANFNDSYIASGLNYVFDILTLKGGSDDK